MQYGHLNLVELFVERGVHVTVKTISVAVTYNQTDIFEYLDAHSKELVGIFNTIEGTQLLIKATELNLVRVVNFLLKKKVSFSSGSDNTAVHVAAERGNLSMLACFYNHDPELLSIKSALGLTPLHVAVFHKKLHIVQYLIDQDVNGNTADSDGFTPFMYAARQGFVDAIPILACGGAVMTQAALDEANKRGYNKFADAVKNYYFYFNSVEVEGYLDASWKQVYILDVRHLKQMVRFATSETKTLSFKESMSFSIISNLAEMYKGCAANGKILVLKFLN